ncbi:MAG: hypothetical protein UR28_C0002G0027 [Candidatus Peregrinibacteria bacterium GW2011_GWF2_33_10]|nr:MAG: hypothetical protein UR28_C0002G0027 [Candidatus Peregrinibacteria bacterium GW2011_GWF2_33_10]OGJ45608.1 MAG: hypothetical protein A2263_00705 [Candidatus Peregrinibacteria bacterium RIFOXYA2_FULL_33_21]
MDVPSGSSAEGKDHISFDVLDVLRDLDQRVTEILGQYERQKTEAQTKYDQYTANLATVQAGFDRDMAAIDSQLERKLWDIDHTDGYDQTARAAIKEATKSTPSASLYDILAAGDDQIKSVLDLQELKSAKSMKNILTVLFERVPNIVTDFLDSIIIDPDIKDPARDQFLFRVLNGRKGEEGEAVIICKEANTVNIQLGDKPRTLNIHVSTRRLLTPVSNSLLYILCGDSDAREIASVIGGARKSPQILIHSKVDRVLPIITANLIDYLGEDVEESVVSGNPVECFYNYLFKAIRKRKAKTQTRNEKSECERHKQSEEQVARKRFTIPEGLNSLSEWLEQIERKFLATHRLKFPDFKERPKVQKGFREYAAHKLYAGQGDELCTFPEGLGLNPEAELIAQVNDVLSWTRSGLKRFLAACMFLGPVYKNNAKRFASIPNVALMRIYEGYRLALSYNATGTSFLRVPGCTEEMKATAFKFILRGSIITRDLMDMVTKLEGVLRAQETVPTLARSVTDGIDALVRLANDPIGNDLQRVLADVEQRAQAAQEVASLGQMPRMALPAPVEQEETRAAIKHVAQQRTM